MLKRLAVKVAEQIEGDNLFGKGIFNYLCADFTCQAVTNYVIIARKIFASGTTFRVKVASEYMNLATLVEKGRFLPEKRGLSDALPFLKEIRRTILSATEIDAPTDPTELTAVDINCNVRRGLDGRLEGVDRQEILTPMVSFESQYALNIVDAKTNERVYSHLFAQIGDSEDKNDFQWLPSSAVKELANKSEKFEAQVTLDSNFASVYLPSDYSRVLVRY
jgi:hypothetical protein